MCYPLPEISHLVSWPRVKNLGFSVNHSIFLFYELPFCVGNFMCSCFQLELRSLEFFLKILVFNRFVAEISHRKLWFDKESFLRKHKGHSTVLNLWGGLSRIRKSLSQAEGDFFPALNKSGLFFPQLNFQHTQNLLRFWFWVLVIEDLVAVEYETGHVRWRDSFNLNRFESTPR